VIGGGGETCFAVQPLKTTKLRAVEIVVIVITASLENDHIFPRRGETAAAVPPPAPEPTMQTSQDKFISRSGTITLSGRTKKFVERGAGLDS